MVYTVVDIETTGLSKHRHRITEIAAARIEDGKIVDEFQTLVNPGVRIPGFITRLTGIDDEMVKDAPRIEDVIPKFADFLGDNVLVAHNAAFDYGFLSHNALTNNIQLGNERICTRKIANRLLPDLRSKKLGCLCEHFGVQNIQAHRAMADVHATVGIFNNMVDMLSEKGFKEKEDILKFQNIPKSKLKF
ncbi:3'-5' exonuclease [Candidatus Woesearchaeota archaeon]|nr:3'-5' exonuclease [Candidatus Woesearchaeota archaeon]